MNDILIDSVRNPIIRDGDFVTGNSEQQHIDCIVEAPKGLLRQFPISGFGIKRFLKGSKDKLRQFERELKIELKSDVFSNPEVNIKNIDNLEIKV
ncbi:MAG: hypothetical protein N4A49_01765 [Marinifilaceae bacterium]|jgi:hypothetical protein|nr:hypothetical protein [Marinifilaceae bacterium]